MGADREHEKRGDEPAGSGYLGAMSPNTGGMANMGTESTVNLADENVTASSTVGAGAGVTSPNVPVPPGGRESDEAISSQTASKTYPQSGLRQGEGPPSPSTDMTTSRESSGPVTGKP
jgi:hypothetical protein